MAVVDKKKLGALADKHAEKKAPPKKPGGGGGKPPGGGDDHVAEEAQHEGDSVENEQAEHDEGDADIAQQQAGRIANGNGDDGLMDLASGLDAESEEVPEFALDADIWERAKAAVRGLDSPPADEDVAAIIVHTYDALGGELAGEGDGDGTDGGDEGDDQEDDGGDGGDQFGGG